MESTWFTWRRSRRRQKAAVDSASLNGGGDTFQVNEEESYNIVSDGIFDDVVGNDMDVCDAIGSGVVILMLKTLLPEILCFMRAKNLLIG